MGFQLRCAIARVDDDTSAAEIARIASTIFPAFVRVRRFTEPFRGVIAGCDHVALTEEVLLDVAAHGYADEDAAHEAVYEAVPNGINELSREIPGTSFAFVEVECFGGTCMFEGFVVDGGVRTHAEPSSASAHVRLFAQLGVVDPAWYFAPFSRGFLETGRAADEARQAITFRVRARWDEPFRLAAMRAGMLPAPWRVTVATETTFVLVHGDDFLVSLNAIDDQVELRATSHVALEQTQSLAHELADDDVALEISDADGAPI